MKIIMALMGLDIGGAETHVMELSRALAARGHEIILASNGGAYVPALKKAGLRHVTVPMNQRDAGKMLQSLKLLRRLIAKEKPDLVHAHARIPAFLCGILRRQMHFPLITTAHWVFEVTPLLRLMTDWGQYTVAVSEDIKEYLIREYQIPADRISVTINGIDTGAFSPGRKEDALRRDLGLGSGPVVCHVSRLDESRAKAAFALLEAWPELLRGFPTARLLLIGDGDRGEELRQRAAEINGKAGFQAVVMTGARTDIAALVSLGDIFVGASRAALEGMSEAKPTVLAGNEGYLGLYTPDILEKARQTNFCFRGEAETNASALLADLRRVLALSPEDRKTLGEAGRKAVLAHYSVDKMTDDYLAAYEALLHPVKPIKAVISGYYGYGNLGDDAILLSISRQLESLEQPVRLTVLSRKPEDTRRRFGLRAVQRFSPFSVLRTVAGSDAVISGGGSLLQDSTSTRSLRYYLAVIALAERLGKPVFLYANGIGPVSRPENRRQVCHVLDKCAALTLRDADSLEELRSMGLSRDDLTVTADPAFSLKASVDGRAAFTAAGVPQGKKLLGLSVRELPGGAFHAAGFASLCDRLSREMGLAVVLLPMQQPGDGRASRRVQELMKEPSWVLDTPEKPEDMLARIGCLDAMVSMRLHSIIFAAKERVPVVGCVYDPKVEAFLKLLDMPSCGTADNFDGDAAFVSVRKLLANPEKTRRDLDARVRPMEEKASETVRLFREFLPAQ